MKLIFLDIDGVLNSHQYNELAGSNSIDKSCVEQFNRILAAVSDAKIVLISAWRYMILKQDLTLLGFQYLLQTHGVHCVDRLIGYTVADEKIAERKGQIEHYLSFTFVHNYVVLDDLFLDIENQVQTNGKIGLTKADANDAIDILTR